MKYQPRLDGLRGLSVIAIFLYHTGNFAGGWIVVQVFCVLSGYLITGILAESLQRDASPSGYFRSFYIRRALRIFPIYFAYISIAVLLAMWLSPSDSAFRPDIAGNLPYVLTYTYNLHKAFNPQTDYGIFFGHLWSLSIEEQFYLVWPVLLFSLNRRSFVGFCLCVVIAGPLARLLEAGWQWQPGSHARELTGRFIYFFSASHFDAFALGALLNFTRDNAIVANLVRIVSKYALWVAAALGGWMLLLATFAKYNLPISSIGWPNYLPFFFCYIWGYTILNCAGLALIADTNRWRLIGDVPLVRRLGRVSYGFYIFHFPVLWLVAIYSGVRAKPDPLFKIAFVSFSFLIVCLIAELSYRFWETPLLRLKSRFSRATHAGRE